MSFRGWWRQKFNVPSTDPRYLDATDHDILGDLLASMYHDGIARRADPHEAAKDETLHDPDRADALDEQLRQQLASGGKLHSIVRNIKRAKEQPPPTTVVRIGSGKILGVDR